MFTNIGKVFVLAILASFILTTGCNQEQAGQQAQLPPPPAQPVAPPQQVAPVPAAPVAAAPAAPPATPLMPVGDTVASPEPSTSSKGSGGKASIDKPIGGEPTSGDELLGAYTCKIDSKQLQIGPIKPPPFGCKIFKAGDGSLKVGSTSEGAGSLKGSVTDQTALGFFITGKYEMSGNTLAVKSRMKTKTPGQKYAGSGRGRLNDDKSAQIKYTLTMTKK